jgi:hypothetical protein
MSESWSMGYQRNQARPFWRDSSELHALNQWRLSLHDPHLHRTHHTDQHLFGGVSKSIRLRIYLDTQSLEMNGFHAAPQPGVH